MNKFPVLSLNQALSGEFGCGFYTITPTLAAHILEYRNPKNRNARDMKVDRIRADLVAGRFMLNGESVIFDKDGNLLDGQHRFRGCVETGVSFVTLVALGIDPDARATVDQGTIRTTADVLAIDGTAHAALTAAIAKLAAAYMRGDGSALARMGAIPRAEITDLVKSDILISDAAAFVGGKIVKGLGGGSLVGFTYWLLATEYGHETAAAYCDKVLTGANLEPTSGALHARNRLMAERHLHAGAKVEILLRGFVAEYTGKPIKRLAVVGNIPDLPRKRLAAA